MRKAILLGLVVVLLVAGAVAVGCGGGGTDKAAVTAVQASLGKINTAIQDLTAKGTAMTLTVADIKSARDSLKPEVQSIIDNGKKIKGADTGAVQKAWTDLDTAVTGLPDTATLLDIAPVLMTKLTPLTDALDKITAVAAAAK